MTTTTDDQLQCDEAVLEVLERRRMDAEGGWCDAALLERECVIYRRYGRFSDPFLSAYDVEVTLRRLELAGRVESRTISRRRALIKRDRRLWRLRIAPTGSAA